MNNKIYLDYNASAPLHPCAWQAMKPILECKNSAYNASAIHSFGREGHKTIEKARIQIAGLVNTPSNQVIFNSGATEGNNTVLWHFAHTYPNDTILVSSAEHASILSAATTHPNIKTIPVLPNGLLDELALENLLQEHSVSLVSCMMVNNESGIIQGVSNISALTHKFGALFHCDAVQAAGRIPINMQKNGIDFLTLSAHKIGGPQGVGTLILGLCGQTPTLIFGGGQEKSARAGTQNTAGIAGFGAAAQHAKDNITRPPTSLETLRNTMEQQLKEISPDIIIHGEHINRVANTSFFSLPNTNAQTLLMAFDIEGIALSNGSACSSGTVKPSHVLKAMGCDEKTASSALRISMGWATKESDINAFLNAWKKIHKRLN